LSGSTARAYNSRLPARRRSWSLRSGEGGIYPSAVCQSGPASLVEGGAEALTVLGVLATNGGPGEKETGRADKRSRRGHAEGLAKRGRIKRPLRNRNANPWKAYP